LPKKKIFNTQCSMLNFNEEADVVINLQALKGRNIIAMADRPLFFTL